MSTGSNVKIYTNFGPCLFYQAKNKKKEILAGSLQKIWSLWPWPSSFSPPFLLQKCQRTERRKLTMRNDTACWSDENGYA